MTVPEVLDVVVETRMDVVDVEVDGTVKVTVAAGSHATNDSETHTTKAADRRIEPPPIQRHSPPESCDREEPKGTLERSRLQTLDIDPTAAPSQPEQDKAHLRAVLQ